MQTYDHARAALWDTAIKFSLQSRAMTSPDHLEVRVLTKSFQHSTTSTPLTSFAAKKCSSAIATCHVAGLDITLVAPGKFSFDSQHECRNICRSSRVEKQQSNTSCVQSVLCILCTPIRVAFDNRTFFCSFEE